MGAHFFVEEIMQLKESKTYDEQVEILVNKGLEIDDSSEVKAFLNLVNYYRFSGYFLPFIDRDSKTFFYGISFERLKNIYYFDADLRNLIMGAIDEIEIYLKSQISYYHSQKYGAEGYLDSKNYNKNHNHDAFIKRVDSCVDENKRTLVIKHHVNNYGGHFPLWVLIEYFSIGMLSYFYRDLKNNDKAAIAREVYGVNYQVLDSWFRCITDLRNKCAHYSRLYYWIFTAMPKMPQGEKYVPTRRLFAQLYMLKMMYPDHQRWNDNFVKPLSALMRKYKPYLCKSHIDFPYRWKSMLLYK